MVKKLKHDSLVKTIMTDPVAAQEFLEYYLPTDFKSLVDLSKITVEKESYIEESLSKKYSDIVYGVATKKHGKAFVYILIEAHQALIIGQLCGYGATHYYYVRGIRKEEINYH